jgi:hypothetical protein
MKLTTPYLVRAVGLAAAVSMVGSCATYVAVSDKAGRAELLGMAAIELAAIGGAAAVDQARCNGTCPGITNDLTGDDGTRGWGGSLLLTASTIVMIDILAAVAWDALAPKPPGLGIQEYRRDDDGEDDD